MEDLAAIKFNAEVLKEDISDYLMKRQLQGHPLELFIEKLLIAISIQERAEKP